ncbi:glycoside hydrolase family 127 protein [Mucilaginibacter xinganensis]|uniref:Non-reducing end beta-L-arabinofuranosidase n=1 Tax=Mucilaginibacter xinganensis TaxID=1234841 RepID=A0A223NYW4_9SPHI|nr:beta-L-arabinofuranosidase domain-containing protein [Mucilaginibacter xinganensis]ASU35026.1 Non-reducing end beta-L-arabinofuranosidase [Mucilaginibacter xinganensis]
MEKRSWLFWVLFILSVQACCANNDKVYGPIVPNKINDRYVPARYQNIGGLLGYRMNINLEKRLLQIDSATLLSGFKKRPGSQTWIGEHVGKFLFSASKTYAYNHDARIKHLMDDMVQKYIACQMPDGYLGTYLLKDRWTEWDVWAHKYAIIGLLNYYSVTGYRPALQTAVKAADLICRTFGDGKGKRDLMTAGEHNGLAPGSILEPMVDLYRYTGEKRYLDFCKYILRAYEQPTGPKIVSQLDKYGDVTRVGDAKAYEMLSCFLGILKYYKLTGEEKYLKLLQCAWLDIKSHRLYITGTSSDHEVFQPPGVLNAGNENNMGEGCVTVTWIQFNLQLLQITGEPKYAEELERSVYNHLLAAENPETGCVSYYTALQGAKPYRCDQGFSCCLSSVPRGISLIPEMMGGKINSVFTLLMYENGEATTNIPAANASNIGLKIKMSTQFPLEGKVDVIVNPSATAVFTVNFRVPEWSANFSAKIGDKTYTGKKGELLSISRKWKAGDHVAIAFDMPLQIIPGGISYPDAIAFKRGPQVLAIDQGLNPVLATLNQPIVINEKLLVDKKESLPGNWDWKEAYSIDMRVNNKLQKVTLVPFSEAGQSSANIAVWIKQ